MEGEVRICRLCFTTIDGTNFETVEGLRTEMIKIVSIPLNLSISEEPVMCGSCAKNLQRCFDFKMTCLNTEDCVKTFANIQDPVKVDLQEVLMKEMANSCTKIKKEICRLCFNYESDSFLDLDNIEDTSLKEMLKRCLPELNLSLTIDPLICRTCLDSLEHEFSFMRSCLETEEKIRRYCSVEASITSDKVDLHKVMQFLAKVKTEVKTELEGDGGQPALEFIACNEAGNFSVKLERDENEEGPVVPLPLIEPTIVLVNNTHPTILKTYPCKQCDFQTNSKRDLKIHCFGHGKGNRLYECPLCSFITRHRTVITNHELTHKSADDINWHQCDICTYRTKLKANLRNHMQTHRKPEEVKRFKCEECPYRTLWKRDLERHVLKHKQPEQLTMYKCDYCGFTTKHQRYLKQHIGKLHLGVSESDDTVYGCANCNFTTKLKRSLIPHMLIHRNPEDLKIYRCSVCSYQAKWKESVKKHELIHKNKYKCDECDFETTLRRYLDKHKLAHRSFEDMPIYSCDNCSYQTRRKNGLQNHMLVHKKADEVKMHPCPHCNYKTKRLQDLKQHVLVIHTDDITVYSCEQCPYQTKYKYNFRQHGRMMHRSPAELIMHKCDQCDFATKYKSSLLSHVVSYHKSAGEITMIKCPECEFETKRRECLRMHLVTHKRPDELEMFRCGQCGFQSKYKRALKKHMQGHRPDAGGKEASVFRCSWCGFETKWKQTIRKHWRRHVEAGVPEEEGVVGGWSVVQQEIKTIKEELVA